MPNINYIAGRNREYRTMQLLEVAGYDCIRAAGSHGTWDVIGVGTAGVLLVQVKYNTPPSASEWEAMREAPAPTNATKLVHLYKRGKHAPEVLFV